MTDILQSVTGMALVQNITEAANAAEAAAEAAEDVATEAQLRQPPPQGEPSEGSAEGPACPNPGAVLLREGPANFALRSSISRASLLCS